MPVPGPQAAFAQDGDANAQGNAQDDTQNNAQESAFPQDGVAITDVGTVELHVADQPLSDVLHLLSLEGRRNIIASPNVSGTVTANLYGVTFEQALRAVLLPNGADFRIVGPFIYVYTKNEIDAMSQAPAQQLVTKVFHLNYISSRDAQSYIAPLLKEGESASGSPEPETGLESQPDQGGGDMSAAQDFVVIHARVDSITRIVDMLEQIDIRPQQVLIEATILRAELNEQNALGIDFTVVGGVDLELLGAGSNAIQDLTLGQLPQERFELFNAIGTTSLTDNISGGGMTLGIIKDKVAIFLRALEEVTDTTVLANPKLLALNKQKGQVIVGRRDGYLTTTVTATQAIQTVKFLETGTQLIFRPFIGTDGYIRMEIHPEDSVGFVNAQGLPSEQTTEVTTNVIVKDGHTILIGGLFREVGTSTRSQVPSLGDLPGIGALFRSTDDSTVREEVIILMTVKIVKDHEDYARTSLNVLDEFDRVRVGSRRGMMPIGRERLAQAHYAAALAHFEEGNRRKALWYVKMALRNHPRMLPAIHLRERILGDRIWDEEASISRDFIRRLMAREKGYFMAPRVTDPAPANGEPDAEPSQPGE